MNTLRFVQQNVRSISTSARILAKNHYDSLGITPKATQADVKMAYYKLSMVYHPDKNEGSENAAQKFRDISEAYEVLGNVRLRKLYDKGVSHIGIDTSSDTYEHPSAKFYRSREHRTRPPSTGRTPIYDFDEWSRSHYGATFARDMERKKKAEFRKSVLEKEDQDIKNARLILAIGTILAVFMYFSYGVGETHDVTYVVGDSAISGKVSK